MADTIREQIIAAYVTRLASWTTGNGFNYSCGGTVGRAISHIEDSDLPACNLVPGEEEAEQRYGQNVCQMDVKLEAFSKITTENRSKVQEKLLGDAIKIMTDPSVTVTTKIEEISYSGGGPASVEKSENEITAISARFRIKYETLIGNPYSQ